MIFIWLSQACVRLVGRERLALQVSMINEMLWQQCAPQCQASDKDPVNVKWINQHLDQSFQWRTLQSSSSSALKSVGQRIRFYSRYYVQSADSESKIRKWCLCGDHLTASVTHKGLLEKQINSWTRKYGQCLSWFTYRCNLSLRRHKLSSDQQ